MGQDVDRDGLPDDWEYFQLQIAGISPSSELFSLDTLTIDGDSDGDGSSNFAEFVGGTFAFIASDQTTLKVSEFDPETDMVAFEIFAVAGKSYALSSTPRLGKDPFDPYPLRLENRASASGQIAWTSNSTGFRKIYVPLDPEAPLRIFRLRIL